MKCLQDQSSLEAKTSLELKSLSLRWALTPELEIPDFSNVTGFERFNASQRKGPLASLCEEFW